MITYEQVLALHNTLELTGEVKLKGIKNNNLIHSAIMGQYYYNSFLDQLCHVAFSINAYHCFNDGNKRTCYLILKSSGLMFNDYLLADVIMAVADGKIRDKDIFVSYVKSCIVI